jgi:predicted transcriptional regulator
MSGAEKALQAMSDDAEAAGLYGDPVDLTGMSLDGLAEFARSEHRRALGAITVAVEHAIRAGEALIAIKAEVPSGEWKAWLAENFPSTHSTAVTYMRLAIHQDQVRASEERTITGAHKMLVGVPGISRAAWNARPAEQKAEAKALRDEGMTQRQIADLFGVNVSTVKDWLDPTWKRKRMAAKTAARRRQDAARKALAEKERRQERDRLAKAAVGTAETAYSSARRLASDLDKALADAAPAQRETLREALALAHKTEDAIVAALKQARVAA